MKITSDYKRSKTRKLAPIVDLILKDPAEENEIFCHALIDTGFDGDIAIPNKEYNDLNLVAYEHSETPAIYGESAFNKKYFLRVASGTAIIKGIDVSIAVTIVSNEEFDDVLIGRGILESFDLTLKGKEKKLIMEFIEEED